MASISSALRAREAAMWGRELRPTLPGRPDLPRQALRDAQRTARTARGAAQAACALALQAAAAGSVARRGLGVFSGLDGRVAEWRGDKLKIASPGDHTPLPHDVAAARQASSNREQNLLDAEEAAALLVSESAAASAAAGAADEQVQAAVIGVVREDAHDLVRRLREIEAEAGLLRVSLATYASQWSAADGQWKPLPWQVQQIALDAHHGMIAGLAVTSWSEVAGCWADYRQALARDADATPPASLRP